MPANRGTRGLVMQGNDAQLHSADLAAEEAAVARKVYHRLSWLWRPGF